MMAIVITGGIGSGKTAVTDYLSSKGYPVIDTDVMAHEMTSPGGKAITYIRNVFGDDYISADGSMDREKVRSLVLKYPDKKRLLERGTTEVIIKDTKALIKKYRLEMHDAVFVAIPLFYENGGNDDGTYDQVWLVTADIKTRLERIRKRDNLPLNIINKFISKQLSDAEKSKKADVIIDNSGTLEDLHKQIDKLLQERL